MTRNEKIASRLFLAGLLALPIVASCGSRGGLARPEPILNRAPASEVVVETAAAEPVREQVVIRPRVNEFGGEIPEPAPTDPIASTPLTDPVSPDDD